MTQTVATPQGSKQAVDKDAIRPFPKVNVPEADLTELRRRVNATRWPERETVTDATQGVQLTATQALANYWANNFLMVAQKCQPAPRRIRPRTTAPPARDRSLRDVEAKHQQFAVNVGCSPGGILSGHAEYCLLELCRDRLFSASPTLHFSRP